MSAIKVNVKSALGNIQHTTPNNTTEQKSEAKSQKVVVKITKLPGTKMATTLYTHVLPNWKYFALSLSLSLLP